MKGVYSLLLLLSVFSATAYAADDKTAAPNTSAGFNTIFNLSSGSGGVIAQSDVTLYNFSSDLLKATEDCSPYQEDFVLKNPMIKSAVADTFGDIAFQIPIEIEGKNGDYCHFTVQYGILGQKYIYDCYIDDNQRRELIEAMKDRSLDPISETFVISAREYTDAQGQPAKTEEATTTITAGRFMVKLTELQNTMCRLKVEALSDEEQDYLEQQSKILPLSFREATADCEPSVADYKMLYETEHVEMLGWQDDKCHLNYRHFDLFVPKEKLSAILTYDDVADLIFSLEDAQYNYQQAYSYDGLMFELSSCYRKTELVENHRQRMHYGEKMEVTFGVLRQDSDKGCEVELVNTLTLDRKTTDYGVVCFVPTEELEEIIAPYLKYADEFGEKSFENADGNMEWHGSTSTDQTRRIDAKLMYVLQKKNYCKLKTNNE